MKKIETDSIFDGTDSDDSYNDEELFGHTSKAEVYGVLSVSTKTLKNGGFLVSYTFRNAAECIDAVHFDGDICCKEGDIVEVLGDRGFYQGNPQITVWSIKKVQPTDENIKKVLPVSQYSMESIKSEINNLLGSLPNKEISNFISSLLESYPNFYTSSAAKRMHHAWVGGLAEHSLQVAKIASQHAEDYKCNRDIVTAGALLHDIGKIVEIEANSLFSYSDEGQMFGHSYIGANIVRNHAEKCPLNNDVLADIEHIILSHHGEHEYGAVVRPVTKEAMLVHYADLIDASMTKVKEFIESDKSDNRWTFYDPDSKRSYKKT